MKHWKLIKEMYHKLLSFKPDQQCCAVAAVFVMLVLVAAASPNNMASAQSVSRVATPSEEYPVTETVGITQPEIETLNETLSVSETEPVTEAEEIEDKPSAVKLNMAYLFPEGSDTSDVWNSYAGKLYKELILKDSQWLSNVYRYSTDKPAALASRLKLSHSSILGKYISGEEGHDPKNPSSWTIPKFQKTNYSFKDGNGNAVNAYSNAKEILTLSSIYAFYQNENPYDAMEAHAANLWDQSHHVKITIGDVYYCDGKLDEKVDESQEPEETANIQPTEILPEVPKAETEPEPLNVGPSGEAAQADVSAATPADAATDAAAESYSAQLEKQLAEIIGNSKSMITKQPKGASVPTVQGCTGHVDLNISVSISGFEGKRGLIAMDNIGGTSKTEGWYGWDEYNCAYAEYLYETDWSDIYGLYPSDVAVINPLSTSEITRYLNNLPQGTSQERRDIIEYALTSVGRIPYYWGGKPEAPNYDVNAFGTLISPDYKGRALKGLDCSGWINWVYWSVTGTKPAAEGTGSLSTYGRSIRKEDLKPGDIMVRISDNSHVVMFLGWESDGSMKCIHESSTGSGNVIISTKSANGTTYRNLLD